LRQARIGRDWRQRDLAEQLGTTVVTVKRWERGYQQPSTYFRVKLCELFGQSAAELGLGEGEPPASMTEEKVSANGQDSLSPTEPEALWMVPYLRNPHFAGRDDLLNQLTQDLSLEQQGDAKITRRAILSQPQAIKGLGGIGKTQIAVEYAYRAREQGRYAHTFWLNAASQEAILASFQTLAEHLPNFAGKDEQDQRKFIAAVVRWIELCPQPWLLIIDNADELTLVQSCLPQQGQGSILLTTRATAVGWLANPIEVEQMGLGEGTQFLLQRTHRQSAADEECNEAANVVIALDGFPLALDQAGAYIEETGCSFGDYLQLYEQHRAILLARRGKQAAHYPNSVATTWSLSFEKIEQAHPAAAELLHLCAYLAPDHIPEELLIDGAAYWPAALQEAVVDPLRFNELLEVLLAFSLVKRLARERLLSLHRLVQVVQQERMKSQQRRRWAERVIRAVNALFPADPEEQVDTWPQCLRYLEQVQACDRLIQQYHLHLSEAADLLNRAGIYLRERASYSLAEPLFAQALVIAEQRQGSQSLQVAFSLNNLGVLYKEQGKYAEAEPLYLRALHIREQILGPHELELAYNLNSLGLLYYEQGRFEEAEPLYLRALHIRERALGPHHSWLASSLNNLGILYMDQGKYAEAEPLLQRALHIREQALGPHHFWFVSSLNNLSILYMDQGRFEEAEPLLQRALHIGEQILGPHHPEITYPLNNLGELYYKQGQYKQAESFLQRSLCIREQALGPEHPAIAYPLNMLANLARDQGRYQQADALYQRALLLRQQSLDHGHPDIAETLHDLALLRERQQRLTEALSLYQQVLSMREQALMSHHPKTTETHERLCAVLQALGRTEEAVIIGTSSDLRVNSGLS